jgi:uncharacterized membrane protein
LPTLLGHHQGGEQRWGSQVGPRSQDARVLFDGTDIAQAKQVIEDLDIHYIYIGQLERNYYNPAGLSKFDRMLESGDLRVVFENQGVTIYEVIE